jgi:hypothetical protein
MFECIIRRKIWLIKCSQLTFLAHESTSRIATIELCNSLSIAFAHVSLFTQLTALSQANTLSN